MPLSDGKEKSVCATDASGKVISCPDVKHRGKEPRYGDIVQISEGSGLDSGVIGELVPFSEYARSGGDMDDFLIKRQPLSKLAFIKAQSKRGQPLGHYPINGYVVMFKNRVLPVNR